MIFAKRIDLKKFDEAAKDIYSRPLIFRNKKTESKLKYNHAGMVLP